MSAEALAKLRSSGRAPVAVWVVVGECEARLRGLPDTIHIRATDNPCGMDWRPVFGLHVDVFNTGASDALLDKTLAAIEAAQPKAVSVACEHGVVGLSPEHEMTLHRIWRRLCT